MVLLAMWSDGTIMGPFQIASTSTESHDMELSTTALNNTTVVFWYGRWVLVRLMGQGH